MLTFAVMRGSATEITCTGKCGESGIIDFIFGIQKYRFRTRNIAMPQPERILRMRTVLERTGLSRSTLYRKMREGTFPNQVRISEHCCGWHESAINRWIANPAVYTKDKTAETIPDSPARSRQRLLA